MPALLRTATLAVLAMASPASADDWEVERCGIVVEASAGAGLLHHGPWSIVFSVFAPSDRIARYETPALDAAFGVGGWLEPRVALTARVVATGFHAAQLGESAVPRTAVAAFVGPTLQYWLPPLHGAASGQPSLWLGGGLGLAVLDGSGGYRGFGVGVDARAGYAHGALQLSVELTDGIYDAEFSAISAVVAIGVQNL